MVGVGRVAAQRLLPLQMEWFSKETPEVRRQRDGIENAELPISALLLKTSLRKVF